MHRLRLTLILLLSAVCFAFARDTHLQTTLKEDYYLEMASRDGVDPDIRVIWYDSLLNISKQGHIDIQLKKLALMREAGHAEQTERLADEMLKGNRHLPLHQLLPLLFQRAMAINDRHQLFSSLAEFNHIWDIPKPDSLKYWDIKVGFSIFSTYSDLNDFTKAREWLRRMEQKLATDPLSKEFRQDAEGRLHGSRAILYIYDNNLDSAYKEVKMVRELATEDKTRMGALMQTAQIYIAKGQLDAAEQYLGQALKYNVDGEMRRTALYLMAQCLINEKRYGEALHVLASYPRKTIKANSIGNLRAYYILRGQAFAGEGNLVLAYNSLDSALVVSDSIIRNSGRLQAQNAALYLDAEKRAATATEKLDILRSWLIALSILLLVTVCTATILLLANLRLRMRAQRQRADISKAREVLETARLMQHDNREREDDMNRRQSALLLRMAHIDTALNAIKRKLTKNELDRTDRTEMLRKLNEIAGRENMWDLFEMQFETTNSRFLALLGERHPELSKSEKRMCAFMLAHLSTKEIAELIDRSPRTVDVTKYNLRRKLNITEPTETYLERLAAEANLPRP